ncbi:MAG TPA: divalent-cation tolerance protein CutA [Terriglobia bacterium]|nr:divalent-cation tolerance protein CutA [Terriglobia bacterium]
MTDKIVVLVTTGSLREGKKIARHLVESRLAACVNISSPIRSIYRWQGKLSDDHEYLLIIKTSRGLFAAVRAAVLKIHTYATPEVISLPIVDGSADYLQWLDSSLAKQGE